MSLTRGLHWINRLMYILMYIRECLVLDRSIDVHTYVYTCVSCLVDVSILLLGASKWN